MTDKILANPNNVVAGISAKQAKKFYQDVTHCVFVGNEMDARCTATTEAQFIEQQANRIAELEAHMKEMREEEWCFNVGHKSISQVTALEQRIAALTEALEQQTKRIAELEEEYHSVRVVLRSALSDDGNVSRPRNLDKTKFLAERIMVLTEALAGQLCRCKCAVHGYGCGINESTCQRMEYCDRCKALGLDLAGKEKR